MASEFSYACKDYPEMESCPGHFVAETEDEIWRLMELHASVAHGKTLASGATKTGNISNPS